jgi:hypothetical protein
VVFFALRIPGLWQDARPGICVQSVFGMNELLAYGADQSTQFYTATAQRAEEMPVHGKAYGKKTPYGFSKDLGNRKYRFPHSLSPDDGCSSD